MNSERLCERAGITYRQLDHWIRKGWIRAEGRRGTGHSRSFPREEIRAAVVMGRLVTAGLTPDVAARVARGTFRIGPGVTVLTDLDIEEEAA